MYRTPDIVRGLLLVCICIIAIGSAYSSMTHIANSAVATTTEVAEPTLGQLVANKAIAEYERWHRAGTMRETDDSAIAILQDYWKLGSIPVNEKDLKSSSWQYRHPWSAVFISWVMLEAGAGPEFPYSNNHAKYIVWARENANRHAQQFVAYDIHDQRAAWPEPGDLICMNRRSNRFTLQTITKANISHCDIVVEANKELGFITAIGGNVGQTVNKRIIWLNPAGFIDTARQWKVPDVAEEDPEGPQKEIFAVIKLNK